MWQQLDSYVVKTVRERVKQRRMVSFHDPDFTYYVEEAWLLHDYKSLPPLIYSQKCVERERLEHDQLSSSMTASGKCGERELTGKGNKWIFGVMEMFYIVFLVVVTFLPLLNAQFVVNTFVTFMQLLKFT